ncbi:MAG: LamG-like jellyroll fold domain-containing protein, partial [Acidimicrobiia bacterium]
MTRIDRTRRRTLAGVLVVVMMATAAPAAAFDQVLPPDLGTTASVTQSSTASAATGPEKAIDGRVAGFLAEGSIAATTNSANPWWQADLGSVQTIPRIKVWDRKDGCCTDTLVNASVFVSDAPFTSTDPAVTRAQPGVSEYVITGPVPDSVLLTVDRTGQYVRVQLNGTGALELAEVQIGGPFFEISPSVTPSWGVRGIVGSAITDIDAEVFAIEQIGGILYVGGRFGEAVPTRFGVGQDQPFLMALDAETGDFLDWWRPRLDGAVYALEASPDGSRLFVGGEFASVNDEPLTGGLVALDPATGEVDANWTAHVQRFFSAGPAIVRDLEVAGSWVYAVGVFTNVTTAAEARLSFNRAARMSLSSGNVDPNWRPDITGGDAAAVAVDTSRNRVYLSGTFTAVNAAPNSGNFFTVDTTTGATVPGMPAFPWNSPFRETWAVEVVGDLLFVGGSQHILTVLDADTFGIVNRVVTEVGGGDFQTIEVVGDRVYAGCHCRLFIYDDDQATRVFKGEVRGTVALDAATGAFIDTFPNDWLDYQLSAGPWAIHGAPDGCLWIGGDLNRRVSGDPYVNGLARHCPEEGRTPTGMPAPTNPPRDTTPPGTAGVPTGAVSGDSVTLNWSAATDNRAVAYYLVTRNGTAVAKAPRTTITLPRQPSGTHAYRVAAVDHAGNTGPASGASSGITVAPAPGGFARFLDEDFEKWLLGDRFGGFTFVDNVLDGPNTGRSFGVFTPTGMPRDDAGILIRVGGSIDAGVTLVDQSAGYEQTFVLEEPTPVEVRLDHQMFGAGNANVLQTVLLVNGVRYGTNGQDYVDQVPEFGVTALRTSTVEIGMLAAGTHTLTIAGFVGSQTRRLTNRFTGVAFDDVTVASAAPGIEVVAPLAETVAAGSMAVSVASEDLVDLASALVVELSVDGGATWSPTIYDAVDDRFEATLALASLPEGPATLLARSTDSDGHVTTSAPVPFNVQNLGPPVVTITAPAPDERVAGTVAVTATAVDAIDAVTDLIAEVSITGSAAWNPMSYDADLGRFVGTVDVSTLPEGPTSITVRSTDSDDLAGSATVPVVVDNVTDYDELVVGDGADVYWRLDESSGTVADDAIGSVNGTYSGGPVLGVPGLIASGGTAVSFDGTNDVVILPDSNLLNTFTRRAQTVELWFQADAVTNRQVLFETGGTSRGMSMYLFQGRVYVGAWNTANDASADTPWASGPAFVSTPVEAGVIHHLAMVYDADANRLQGFLDGVSIGTVAGIGTLHTATADNAIGAMREGARFHDSLTGGQGFFFDGVIDEVAVYSEALPTARIVAHHRSGSGLADTAPTISFQAPGSGALVSGSVTVALTAADVEDDSSSLSVDVSTNGGTSWAPAVFDAGSGEHRLVISTSPLGDGPRTISARVTDSGGNRVTATRSITVDNTAPVVNIVAPLQGATVSGVVPVSVTAVDTVAPLGTLTVEASLDAGANWTPLPWEPGVGRYVGPVDVSSLVGQSVTILARAIDGRSNTATNSITVTVPSYEAGVIADGADAYWRLGESGGSLADDRIGLVDGTYLGGPTLGVPGLVSGANTAVSFDGVDDRVWLPDSLVTNLAIRRAQTVELWFVADDVDGRRVLYDQGGTSRGLSMYLRSGRVYVGGWNTINDPSADTPWSGGPAFVSAPVSVNTRYHLVLVYDADGNR